MSTIEDIRIIDRAIASLNQEAGIEIGLVKRNKSNQQSDTVIKLPNHSGELSVLVKRNIRPAHLGTIANDFLNTQTHHKQILIADYINPNIAEQLRELNIQFIDTCGNAYINTSPIHVWVKGNKQTRTVVEPSEATRHIFGKAGLKVIFLLLCNSKLVNAPYREIAEKSNVALGAVSKVMTGLKTTGFVINKNRNGERQLTHIDKLFKQWAEAYPAKLKPQLKIGDFIATKNLWWKKISLAKYDGQWSGEIAACKYTKYLRPKHATIYLPLSESSSLIAAAKLRKSNNPTIEDNLVTIYQSFWDATKDAHQFSETKKRKSSELAHPILVYADLLSSQDSRNLEAANELYEKIITKHLG